jgi:hypothetical protein
VLSKCANPACDAKLQYLRQGKIYRIDTESMAHASRRAKTAVSAPRDNSPDPRQVSSLQVVADRGGAFRPEYFWLCAECCEDWTIAVKNSSVIVIALTKPLVMQAAAS